MYKALIFDLDGTLLDTVTDLAHATNRILIKHGFKERPEEMYNHYLGGGVYNLIRRALKDQPEGFVPSDAEIESCLPQMVLEQKTLYAEIWKENSRPYPHIKEMLDALSEKGAVLAVVSNKPHHFTVEMVDYFFGRNVFNTVIGQQDGIPVKPEPDMLLNAIRDIGASTASILYVGDTDTDMLTAKNAQAASIGVSWGFRSTDELKAHGADHIVTTPLEIIDIFSA